MGVLSVALAVKHTVLLKLRSRFSLRFSRNFGRRTKHRQSRLHRQGLIACLDGKSFDATLWPGRRPAGRPPIAGSVGQDALRGEGDLDQRALVRRRGNGKGGAVGVDHGLGQRQAEPGAVAAAPGPACTWRNGFIACSSSVRVMPCWCRAPAARRCRLPHRRSKR